MILCVKPAQPHNLCCHVTASRVCPTLKTSSSAGTQTARRGSVNLIEVGSSGGGGGNANSHLNQAGGEMTALGRDCRAVRGLY